MSATARTFEENRDTWGAAAQSNLNIAPASPDLPTADNALVERTANVGASLESFAQVEGAKMNKGDIGFFGSQIGQTVGEAAGAFMDIFRDKSEDGPEAERAELVEELQRTAPKPGPAVLTLG